MLNPAHQRPIRAFVAILTLVALLSLPLSTFGAKGGSLSAAVLSLVQTVTPGNVVAFSASFTNDSGSPLTHFSFSGSAAGVTLQSFYTADSGCSATATGVACDYGSLAVGASKSIIVAYTVPVNYTGESVSFTGAFSADSTSKGKTNTTQRQNWSKTVSVNVSSDPDAFATWNPPNENGQFGPFGATQQTTVYGPGLSEGYPVELSHTGGGVCGTGSGFGKTVNMDVAAGDEPIVVEILFARESGLTPSTLKIVWDDEGDCVDVPETASCSPDSDPCFIAGWAPGVSPPQVKATVYLPHNGRLKGW